MNKYELHGYYETGCGVAEIQGKIKTNNEGYFEEKIQVLNSQIEDKIIKGYLFNEVNTSKLLFIMQNITQNNETQEQPTYTLTKLRNHTFDGNYKGATYNTMIPTNIKQPKEFIRDLEDEINWICGKTYVEKFTELTLTKTD